MLTSRSGSQGSSPASPPQTIEAVRRRARHRLIGAAVLVLIGVLGFPLLFDTEPRPVAGDIPIEIPSRGEIKPIVVASTDEASDPVTKPAAKVGASEAAMPASDGLDEREVVVEREQPEPKTSAKSNEASAAEAKKEASLRAAAQKEAAQREAAQKENAKKAQLEEEKAKKASAESDRARALLENKAPAGTERLVVQVGAFAEASSARATRLKLERAGLTTYTHVAETSSGSLIRVRVGPFNSRAEADKVAAKVKALGLPARILTL